MSESSVSRGMLDALQRECALDNEIGILVTRNARDYPKAAVEILSPADFMRLRAAEHATKIRRSHGH